MTGQGRTDGVGTALMLFGHGGHHLGLDTGIKRDALQQARECRALLVQAMPGHGVDGVAAADCHGRTPSGMLK